MANLYDPIQAASATNKANTQKILTGAGGLFVSILGLASGNPVAAQGGLSSFFSILSPTQRSMVQYGTTQAVSANNQYEAALAGKQLVSNPLVTFGLIGLAIFIVYKIFRRRR
jgi:hypothetical protein